MLVGCSKCGTRNNAHDRLQQDTLNAGKREDQEKHGGQGKVYGIVVLAPPPPPHTHTSQPAHCAGCDCATADKTEACMRCACHLTRRTPKYYAVVHQP